MGSSATSQFAKSDHGQLATMIRNLVAGDAELREARDELMAIARGNADADADEPAGPDDSDSVH